MTKEELRRRINANLEELEQLQNTERDLKDQASKINGEECGIRNRIRLVREQIDKDVATLTGERGS